MGEQRAERYFCTMAWSDEQVSLSERRHRFRERWASLIAELLAA
jgi:hypothetical protein